MVELVNRVARVAASDAPVLVLGETGTGKELVARAIHDQSARAKGPFVAENCSVFAEGVLSSELFGHEAGSFTGATSRRKGVFEQAHTGTLLLDEIGELSPRVQAALLRVLQEGALRRVGGESKVAVDVRVVAATHKDLTRMVREGTFREDLYFRLRGATIDVPPLRARPGDIELLVMTFLDEIAARRAAPRFTVSREAQRAVSAYLWPGNVRELKAEIERWAVFCDGVVEERDLAPEIREGRAPAPAPAPMERPRQGGAAADIVPLAEVTARAERDAIVAALSENVHNLSATARSLCIDRNTLKRKMAAYRIDPR
jgi:DNA-binding NtrC family response regulator